MPVDRCPVAAVVVGRELQQPQKTFVGKAAGISQRRVARMDTVSLQAGPIRLGHSYP